MIWLTQGEPEHKIFIVIGILSCILGVLLIVVLILSAVTTYLVILTSQFRDLSILWLVFTLAFGILARVEGQKILGDLGIFTGIITLL